MLAHAVGNDALPAPPWLLAYIGIALVLGTAATLRATWPRARWAPVEPEAPGDIVVHPGHVVGLALYSLTIASALIGPDSSAANLAPWLVAVVWWVGLPIACLLLGDVVRHLNPFVPVVALLDRGRPAPARRPPAWTAAAFLAAWSWYLLAYDEPGSPRSLARFLVGYAIAAVAGGLVWGRRWLATGEAFGALSAAVGRIGVRGWRGRAPALGTAALMVVWIGGTAFDGFTFRMFWQDVLGTSTGWARALINTVGLVWITAIVAGAYLIVVRVAERGQREDDGGRRLTESLGPALVPMAAGWFLGHDITLLISEGQNALALISDPFGQGWDLFGTYDNTVDYSILTAWWVQWLQLVLIGAGHAVSVVLLHELAMERLPPRAAMRTTWVMAVVTSASIVAACMLVLT
ncbi:MAG: hypothetical protein ACJ739_01690 [Acidimicrobiales bacterium]